MSDVEIYKILDSFNKVASDASPYKEVITESDISDSTRRIADGLFQRLKKQMSSVFSQYGSEAVADAIYQVAEKHSDHDVDEEMFSDMVDEVFKMVRPVEEAMQTKIEKKGNKVVVTAPDGNQTEFDDEETAAAFMGGEMEENKERDQFTTEDVVNEAAGGPFASKEEAVRDAVEQIGGNYAETGNEKPKEGVHFSVHKDDEGWHWDERVDEEEQLDEILPALAAIGGAALRTGAAAAGTAFGSAAADKVFGESEPEWSTFDSDNPEHRKRLQRGTPVVLDPAICPDPKGDRTGIFVKIAPSGQYGKVIRNCDGKEINVHLDDIRSADITNNSVYEQYNIEFEAMLAEDDQLNEDVTVTRTQNVDDPENDTLTVTAVGNDAADELEAIMQNAGITRPDYEEVTPDMMPMAEPTVIDTGEPEHEPSMTDTIRAVDGPEELNAGAGCMEDEVEEARDIEHANTPDEEFARLQTIIKGLSGGLNNPKKHYRKEYPGDNHMAVEEGSNYDAEMIADLFDKFPIEKVKAWVYDTGEAIDTIDTIDVEMAVVELFADEIPYGYQNGDDGSSVEWLYDRYGQEIDDYLEAHGALEEGETEYDDEEARRPSRSVEKRASGPNYEFDPASGLHHDEKLDEKAPPGMEDWIKDRKAEFKKRYGDRWEEVLYATAWKQHNAKESAEMPGAPLDETESFLNLYKTFTER